jgi:hypothetical protein
LQKIYKNSGNKILCDVLFRVVEDEKVVGFLTMTNQFIQIMPFIDNEDFNDTIKTISESNYIIADRSLMVAPIEEQTQNIRPLNEKEKMMRNIRLETQFYSGFRNTIRILLNLYKMRNTKENIREIIFLENMSYRKKRKNIEKQLRQLCANENVFSFQIYDDDILSNIQDIFTCQTDCDKKAYCLTATSKDGTCQMILPEQNLVNGESNEQIYFSRISDEILRFKRIQLFMMKADTYLYLSSSEYKIYSNEFVIAKSALTDKYFEDLELYPLEKYVKNTTYETANPSVKPPNPTQSWIEAYNREK